jgi:hypothetical protein
MDGIDVTLTLPIHDELGNRQKQGRLGEGARGVRREVTINWQRTRIRA